MVDNSFFLYITDPDQAMSEHPDKELLWNIQLLSQVH